MTTLTVGIITRNRKKMLQDCLISISEKIKNITKEVIIVDNNSKDGTVRMIKDEFRYVKLISNKKNHGVAGSRNQIIEKYDGRYLLIIDDDTKVLSSTFENLISYMDDHSNVGVLGCRVLTPEYQVYPSARSFPLPRHVFAKRLSVLPFFKFDKLLNGYQHALKNDNSPRTVDFVIGCFQLICSRAQEKVGLLDPVMKYGFEDADFCARMRRSGFLTVYYPGFEIIHYKGIVSETTLNRFLLYYMRSYSWFYLKHRCMIRKQVQHGPV